MELYLLRHGKAEDFHPDGDSARALVPKGYEQARRVGVMLAAAGFLPEIVLTSPLVRARQTADEFCTTAGLPGPVVQGWLACGCAAESISAELAAFHDFKRVLIVGHEPDFSQFIQWSVGAYGATFEMKKGGLACLRVSPPARHGTLRFLIPPKLAPLADWSGSEAPPSKPPEETTG
ncbi:MAG: histidine phosphatase family protein [Akkermansiaceae bacterium]|nr:histidine phosphatase family protein [Akkermansiaceae bacterium]